MRNITINGNAVDAAAIAETTTYPKLHDAIGYLSLWNMGFDQVTITLIPEQVELVATYTYADPSKAGQRYVIGAVWHDDHFGFHS